MQALTREKIVAAQSRQFVCIADDSKLVQVMGKFPLPVEVIPMSQRIKRQFEAMGAQATLRLKDGAPLVTDNGQHDLMRDRSTIRYWRFIQPRSSAGHGSSAASPSKVRVQATCYPPRKQ